MSRLLVREKVFAMTGKEFEVKAGFLTGPTYTVEGDYSSPHDRKTLYDDDGRAIYRMKSRILSARRNMRIKEARSGSTVVTLRRQGLMPIHMKGSGTIQVWKGEDTERSPWLEVTGASEGSTFTVYDVWRSMEAALVQKKAFTLPSMVLGKSSYMLEIKPGYDEPLMIMINIAIDSYF